MHVAGRLYLRDYISIRDIQDVESRILWSQTEKKKSVVKKYMKEIVRLLSTVKIVTIFELRNLDKLLISAGFVENKRKVEKFEKTTSLKKMIRWIGARINQPPEIVANNMPLSEIVPFTQEIAMRIIQDSFRMIRANHDYDNYIKDLEEQRKALENSNTEDDGKEITKKVSVPKIQDVLRRQIEAQ